MTTSVTRRRGERWISPFALGIAIGMMVAGLLVPLALGESPTSGDAQVAVGTGTDASDDLDADDTAVDTTALDAGATVTTVAGGRGTRTGGGTSGGVAGDDTGDGGGRGGDTGLTASDVGVSATEIKVGVLILDLGALGDLGLSFGFGDMQKRWQVFFDQVNAAGGVNGRKLVPVFRTFDPTQPDTMLAVCNTMAKDDGVFAVFNNTGYQGPPVLCLTNQYGVPFFGMTEFLDEYYEQSNGRLFSTSSYYGPSTSRRAAVKRLHEAGLLKGRKLGVVSDSTNEGAAGVDKVMIPELKRLGYTVLADHELPADQGAFQAIPISVSEMRRVGVDTVLLELNQLFSLQWVQQASGQAYLPRYLQSDYPIPVDSSYQNMPQAFNGTIAVTSLRTGERFGRPEPALDAQCRTTYEKATGEQVARDSDAYVGTLGVCSITQMFVRAAAAAGPVLTRDGLSKAMQALGPVEIAYTGPASFKAGKFVATDHVRRIQWEFACKCWKPIDEFGPLG